MAENMLLAVGLYPGALEFCLFAGLPALLAARRAYADARRTAHALGEALGTLAWYLTLGVTVAWLVFLWGGAPLETMVGFTLIVILLGAILGLPAAALAYVVVFKVAAHLPESRPITDGPEGERGGKGWGHAELRVLAAAGRATDVLENIYAYLLHPVA